MNSIEFSNAGGFPFETDDLAFMQESYKLLQELGNVVAGANPSIIKGCTVAGSSVTDGIVILNGEVLPFQGGTLGTHVAIEEQKTSKIFEDGQTREVYTARHATFAVTGTPWADFKRVPQGGLMSHIVPSGMISMWSGAIADIPEGWNLCNGTNGTPDLSGRFIVGYDPDDTDHDAVGKEGGAKKVALKKGDIPKHVHTDGTLSTDSDSHKHSLQGYQISFANGGNVVEALSYAGTQNAGSAETNTDTHNHDVTGSTGDGGGDGLAGNSHENRPPYYTLAYIMKS